MKRIRIAQIGTSRNSHGNDIFCTLKKLPEQFEIVGYALPENEREKFPERMAAFEGYPELTVEEILTDPTIDAVAVETEEIYLTKYALLAARHKKHMHMEKPGGVDPVLFETLIETVKQNGTVFHAGYMYRYNPFVQELMAQIERGELGEILNVEAQMNCIHPAETRQWLANFPGGMLFFLGCHLVDLIVRIMGAPKRVIPLSACSGMDGVTAKDQGMVALEYDTGISFAKTFATEVGGYARRYLAVVGTKKTVELKPFEMMCETGHYTDRTEYTSLAWDDQGEKERRYFDRYEAMMKAFGRMVAGEQENPYTYDYELMLYKTLLSCCGT